MSFKSLSIVAAAALVLCAGAVQAQTTNGFANGGFETAGTTTAAASWLQAASGYTLSTDAHSGSFSAQLASAAFNAAVMLQNSIEQGGLPALTVGDTPTLSFWAKGTAGGTGNVLFALRYLDGVGNILANSNNVFFQGLINTSAWSQITYNLGAVPTGATAAFIEFSQGIGPIDAGNPAGKVLIDDLYLAVAAPVPEPETNALMLAGLGVIGFIVRRRRRSV
ncbi:MAG: PEP-CTERM sorting domain-containing protein [Burkholderiales bacterium]|nr:PEP-CTERM sorting domain-containing protein [Burkholderiales bacterium]